MVIDTLAETGQNTKDNIGARDSTREILLDRNNERILFEENTTIIKSRDTSPDTIWNRDTWNGGIWDGTYDNEPIVQSVINPNNTFREHIRDTTFKDGATTADWDVTNFRIAMDPSSNQARMYVTMARSETIFKNNVNVVRAIFNAKETIFGNDVVKYFLSARGADAWEEVTLGVEHLFAAQGKDLRFMITFVGNGANETFVEDVNVRYSTV